MSKDAYLKPLSDQYVGDCAMCAAGVEHRSIPESQMLRIGVPQASSRPRSLDREPPAPRVLREPRRPGSRNPIDRPARVSGETDAAGKAARARMAAFQLLVVEEQQWREGQEAQLRAERAREAIRAEIASDAQARAVEETRRGHIRANILHFADDPRVAHDWMDSNGYIPLNWADPTTMYRREF